MHTEARMTQMFPRYFGIHQMVVRGGMLAAMTGGECKLYLVLMHESERRSSREVAMHDRELAEKGGMSRRSIIRARRGLLKLGFIQCRHVEGGGVIYVVCDPETKKPYPGNPGDPPAWRTRKQPPREPTVLPSLALKPAPVQALRPMQAEGGSAPHCRVHPDTTWWQGPGGARLCDKCHPQGVPAAEIFR